MRPDGYTLGGFHLFKKGAQHVRSLGSPTAIVTGAKAIVRGGLRTGGTSMTASSSRGSRTKWVHTVRAEPAPRSSARRNASFLNDVLGPCGCIRKCGHANGHAPPYSRSDPTLSRIRRRCITPGRTVVSLSHPNSHSIPSPDDRPNLRAPAGPLATQSTRQARTACPLTDDLAPTDQMHLRWMRQDSTDIDC